MKQKKNTGLLITSMILAVVAVACIAGCVLVGLTFRTERLKGNSKQDDVTKQEETEDKAYREEERTIELDDFEVLGNQQSAEAQNGQATAQEYLCTYSAERLMTEADVAELKGKTYENLPKDKGIIQMVVNEMYARYGYQFTNPDIQAYFDQKEWYKQITVRNPDMNAVLEGMTEIEKANVQFLSPFIEEV